MKLLDHPNIIKIYDVFVTKKNMLCIVMEYANQGDLNMMIEQRFDKIDMWGEDPDQHHFTEE